LAVIIVFIVYLASYQQPYIPIFDFPFPASLGLVALNFFPFPVTLGLIALNLQACYRDPKHVWAMGVKEAAANNIQSIRVEPRLSLFGTKRTPEDEVRNVWATSWLPVVIFRVIWTTLKLSIIRRAVYVVTQVIHI
jgi:hypothetical protein